MLVLTRRGGEGIMIGDEIEVKILAVSGEKVRVGIDAPREINVYRTEVFERIEAEFSNSQSMNGDGASAGSMNGDGGTAASMDSDGATARERESKTSG